MNRNIPTVFEGSEAKDVLENFRFFGVFVDGGPPPEIIRLIPPGVNIKDVKGWGSYRVCDECIQAIPLNEHYYQCVSCDVDTFDVCEECYKMGGKHDPSHKFERKSNYCVKQSA